MAALVTLDEVRDHLMVDSTAVNPWINLWIEIVSAAVFSWLKDEWRAYETIEDSNGDPLEDSAGDQFPILDSNGEPIAKPLVKGAVLVEIAVQFRFRDGDKAPIVPATSGHGYILSVGATALLNGSRKSTVR